VTEAFLQDFEVQSGTATAEAPEWLESIRRAAMERFATTGFPTSRDEEWRFTPVGPIAQNPWRPALGSAAVSREQLGPFVFGHPEWTTLVFLNGVFSEALSSVGVLAPGLRVGSLSEALTTDGAVIEAHLGRHAPTISSPFTALSTAFVREGGFVHVPANTDVARPMHLVFVTTDEAAGSVTHPRNLIVVEPGARASVIESYVTLAPAGTYWTNAVTEVVAGANSWLEHTRIQRESERAYHIG